MTGENREMSSTSTSRCETPRRHSRSNSFSSSHGSIKHASTRVQVFVRARPLDEPFSNESNDATASLEFPSEREIKLTEAKQETTYRFDHVFSPETTNVEVCNLICTPLIDTVLNGFNGSFMVYGQTGTGKTFTVQAENGLIPTTISQLFSRIQDDKDNEYSVFLSYLQIYHERIYDLLESSRETDLHLREHPNEGVKVEGLSECQITTTKDAESLIEFGRKQLIVAETKLVRASSRSHSLCILRVQKRRHGFNQAIGEEGFSVEDSFLRGRLYLCDLAGSERLKKSGVSGDRLKEAKYINSSLLELGNVIHALSVARSHHIPFRNSTLTRILKESLGGNSRASLMICISSSMRHINETKCSLNFGQRALKVTRSSSPSVELKEENSDELKEKALHFAHPYTVTRPRHSSSSLYPKIDYKALSEYLSKKLKELETAYQNEKQGYRRMHDEMRKTRRGQSRIPVLRSKNRTPTPKEQFYFIKEVQMEEENEIIEAETLTEEEPFTEKEMKRVMQIDGDKLHRVLVEREWTDSPQVNDYDDYNDYDDVDIGIVRREDKTLKNEESRTSTVVEDALKENRKSFSTMSCQTDENANYIISKDETAGVSVKVEEDEKLIIEQKYALASNSSFQTVLAQKIIDDEIRRGSDEKLKNVAMMKRNEERENEISANYKKSKAKDGMTVENDKSAEKQDNFIEIGAKTGEKEIHLKETKEDGIEVAEKEKSPKEEAMPFEIEVRFMVETNEEASKDKAALLKDGEQRELERIKSEMRQEKMKENMPEKYEIGRREENIGSVEINKENAYESELNTATNKDMKSKDLERNSVSYASENILEIVEAKGNEICLGKGEEDENERPPTCAKSEDRRMDLEVKEVKDEIKEHSSENEQSPMETDIDGGKEINDKKDENENFLALEKSEERRIDLAVNDEKGEIKQHGDDTECQQALSEARRVERIAIDEHEGDIENERYSNDSKEFYNVKRNEKGANLIKDEENTMKNANKEERKSLIGEDKREKEVKNEIELKDAIHGKSKVNEEEKDEKGISDDQIQLKTIGKATEMLVGNPRKSFDEGLNEMEATKSPPGSASREEDVMKINLKKRKSDLIESEEWPKVSDKFESRNKREGNDITTEQEKLKRESQEPAMCDENMPSSTIKIYELDNDEKSQEKTMQQNENDVECKEKETAERSEGELENSEDRMMDEVSGKTGDRVVGVEEKIDETMFEEDKDDTANKVEEIVANAKERGPNAFEGTKLTVAHESGKESDSIENEKSCQLVESGEVKSITSEIKEKNIGDDSKEHESIEKENDKEEGAKGGTINECNNEIRCKLMTFEREQEEEKAVEKREDSAREESGDFPRETELKLEKSEINGILNERENKRSEPIEGNKEYSEEKEFDIEEIVAMSEESCENGRYFSDDGRKTETGVAPMTENGKGGEEFVNLKQTLGCQEKRERKNKSRDAKIGGQLEYEMVDCVVSENEADESVKEAVIVQNEIEEKRKRPISFGEARIISPKHHKQVHFAMTDSEKEGAKNRVDDVKKKESQKEKEALNFLSLDLCGNSLLESSFDEESLSVSGASVESEFTSALKEKEKLQRALKNVKTQYEDLLKEFDKIIENNTKEEGDENLQISKESYNVALKCKEELESEIKKARDELAMVQEENDSQSEEFNWQSSDYEFSEESGSVSFDITCENGDLPVNSSTPVPFEATFSEAGNSPRHIQVQSNSVQTDSETLHEYRDTNKKALVEERGTNTSPESEAGSTLRTTQSGKYEASGLSSMNASDLQRLPATLPRRKGQKRRPRTLQLDELSLGDTKWISKRSLVDKEQAKKSEKLTLQAIENAELKKELLLTKLEKIRLEALLSCAMMRWSPTEVEDGFRRISVNSITSSTSTLRSTSSLTNIPQSDPTSPFQTQSPFRRLNPRRVTSQIGEERKQSQQRVRFNDSMKTPSSTSPRSSSLFGHLSLLTQSSLSPSSLDFDLSSYVSSGPPTPVPNERVSPCGQDGDEKFQSPSSSSSKKKQDDSDERDVANIAYRGKSKSKLTSCLPFRRKKKSIKQSKGISEEYKEESYGANC